MSPPIYNPPVPYTGAIPGGINAGRMIRIQGTPTAVSNRFGINLQCGPNPPPREDIGLHLDFRFTQNPPCVVRNSLSAQQWGHEESHGHFPVARGQPFDILILVEHASYKVAINNQHFAEFHHRIPFQRVTYIEIDGEVHVSAIIFEGTIGGGAPHVAPGIGFSNVAPPMPGAVHVMPMPGPHPVGIHGVAPVVYPAGYGHAGGHPGHHPGGHQDHHPGGYPGHHPGGHPVHYPAHSPAIPIATGLAVGAMGAMAYQGHSPKSMKKQKKAMKKAMKHHKHKSHGMHGYQHHHGKHSSSSSSSSSEEE